MVRSHAGSGGRGVDLGVDTELPGLTADGDDGTAGCQSGASRQLWAPSSKASLDLRMARSGGALDEESST